MRVRVDALACDFLREPCLADAAGAEHRYQSMLTQQLGDGSDVGIAAEWRFAGGGQIGK